MTVSNVIYRFNTIIIKIPMAIFTEMENVTLKFIRNFKGFQVSKTNLKKNKVDRLTLSDFKTYYKITVQY